MIPWRWVWVHLYGLAKASEHKVVKQETNTNLPRIEQIKCVDTPLDLFRQLDGAVSQLLVEILLLSDPHAMLTGARPSKRNSAFNYPLGEPLCLRQIFIRGE